MTEPFDLERFIEAQNPHYARVIEELRRGFKTGHWMWFIFPQLRGLGHSEMANRYGIASLGEGRAYMQHPVLGARLVECTALVNAIIGHTAQEIFGAVDRLKFRSSMTLFAEATAENEVFRQALSKYFQGEPDRLTLELMCR